MSKNDEIREKIEGYREKIFAVDEEYWNGKNASPEQKSKWSERSKDPIVFDGLICTDDENCDILYLLKESTYSGYTKYRDLNGNNDKWFPSERAWNFIRMTNDLIDDAEIRIERIWPELCCWTKAYRGSSEKYLDLEKKYREYTEADYNVLKSTAIVNIKKTAGESSSIDDFISEAATEYGELIKKEVQIIDPRIVLCGDTFEQARIIWGQKGKRRFWLNCGAQYFTVENNGKNLLFVEFYHPSAGIKKAVLFAYAKAVFEELKDRELTRQ